jgi:uncharacterized protein (TIGR02118 family)
MNDLSRHRYSPSVDERGDEMVKAFVLYDEAPDPERYEAHVELCRLVPGATFQHGKVFGSAAGEPKYAYYAEFEFPDRDSFKAATASPEFAAVGKDAMELGRPFTVHFASVVDV